MLRLPSLSLRYRIAAIIFVLEAIMMAFVLSATLNHSENSNLAQLTTFEKVITNVLGQLSRFALFTAEYDELQPYIEEVVSDPHVVSIIVANEEKQIVVSSDVGQLGLQLPELVNDESRFWVIQKISNASGGLGSIAINFSHDDHLRVKQESLDLGIAIALTGMAIIAVVGFLIGFLMTRNLEHLTNASLHMAEGDLDARTGLDGRDEISMVGKTFDRMAASVQRYIEELELSDKQIRGANDDLEQKIRDRTQELAIARDQALEASRTKSAFLANMSHELRTPLNAIIGYTDILNEDAMDMGCEQIRPDLKNIRNAGTHLLSLINDVLDLSKIEAGKIEFHVSEFSIESLVMDTIVTIQPLVDKNHNVLTTRLDKEIGTMHGDEIKIRQMLINLFSNACKFTQDGEISLLVESNDFNGQDWIHFRLRDTGIGIPEDKLDQLFNEFSQVDSSATKKYEGTGLGLTITQRLCVMMGGDISVSSKEGVGSTFHITLPRITRDLKQLPALHSLPDAADARSKRIHDSSEGDVEAEGENSTERRSKISTILVIDDDPHMVNMLQRMLGRQGFEVIHSGTGHGGIELAGTSKPDVIILDIMLPDIDGWGVMKLLQSDPHLSGIPIVVVSLTHEVDVATSHGASFIISKPVVWSDLVRVLQQCLRSD